MTIWQIILFGFSIGNLFLGYNWGKAEGIVEGRKAVRKYYEELYR